MYKKVLILNGHFSDTVSVHFSNGSGNLVLAFQNRKYLSVFLIVAKLDLFIYVMVIKIIFFMIKRSSLVVKNQDGPPFEYQTYLSVFKMFTN
jgi:hypothetical protein